jgi:hypothetical protein
VPDLFEPIRVVVGPLGFVLRGFERDEGRAVMQEGDAMGISSGCPNQAWTLGEFLR